MKVNYHTHTTRCNHAVGSEREYVESAIKGGIKELGFADHTPWPYPNYVSPTRMSVAELDDYVNTVLSLKKEYKDKINILLGLEVEYFPKYLDFLYEMKEKYPIDYYILGNHFYETDEVDRVATYYGNNCNQDEMMDKYCETTIEAMKTGLFCYVAHPDLFMRGRKVFDEKAIEVTRKICEAAVKYDIPLEYNLEGACIHDAKKQNTFGTTAFGGYALFWFAVGFSWMIQHGVFGKELAATLDINQLGFAFLGYLIFTLVMTLAASETNKTLFIIFVLIDFLFIGLTFSTLNILHHEMHLLAGVSELLISIVAFYGFAANILNTHFGY